MVHLLVEMIIASWMQEISPHFSVLCCMNAARWSGTPPKPLSSELANKSVHWEDNVIDNVTISRPHTTGFCCRCCKIFLNDSLTSLSPLSYFNSLSEEAESAS